MEETCTNVIIFDPILLHHYHQHHCICSRALEGMIITETLIFSSSDASSQHSPRLIGPID